MRETFSQEWPPVHILLGTYNGARYLREQIQSIQDQEYGHWRLLVRDDGSCDSTLSILREVANGDARIRIIEDTLGNRGPAQNFAVLLEYAREDEAAYVCFADQDDVWQPWKLQRQVEAMMQAEDARAECPRLVHSDLAVVDEKLQPIHGSFMSFQRIRDEASNPLRVLLVQNFVTGCTMLINRALLELAIPIPGTVLVHDWWLALCAAAAGEIIFLPEPSVLYRQHGMNVIGAKGFRRRMNPWGSAWRKTWQEGNRNLLKSLSQVRALRERIADIQGDHDDVLRLIDAYLMAWDRGTGVRRRILAIKRSGVRRQDILTNTLFLLRCSWLARQTWKSE